MHRFGRCHRAASARCHASLFGICAVAPARQCRRRPPSALPPPSPPGARSRVADRRHRGRRRAGVVDRLVALEHVRRTPQRRGAPMRARASSPSAMRAQRRPAAAGWRGGGSERTCCGTRPRRGRRRASGSCARRRRGAAPLWTAPRPRRLSGRPGRMWAPSRADTDAQQFWGRRGGHGEPCETTATVRGRLWDGCSVVNKLCTAMAGALIRSGWPHRWGDRVHSWRFLQMAARARGFGLC